MIGLYGLPAIRKPPPVQALPIIVQIVEIGAQTNLPSAPEEPKPEIKPEKKPEKKPDKKPGKKPLIKKPGKKPGKPGKKPK